MNAHGWIAVNVRRKLNNGKKGDATFTNFLSMEYSISLGTFVTLRGVDVVIVFSGVALAKFGEHTKQPAVSLRV